jgi:hypothetical protein
MNSGGKRSGKFGRLLQSRRISTRREDFQAIFDAFSSVFEVSKEQ